MIGRKGEMVTIPKWQWDEGVHCGTDYADGAEVERYDARMALVRDVASESEKILEFLRPSSDDVILEIGTGTGFFARTAAKYCREVIALDISRTMLATATERAEGENAGNVTNVHAGFLTYEHAGEPVDAVVTQLALHHLPDSWKLIALRRLHQIMRPGGKLFLGDVVYHQEEMETEPSAYFERLVTSLPEAIREGMARHIAREYSTLDWIMRGLLERSGFRVERVDSSRFMTGYFCTRT
jgi:putative AdoMet-dependent methyltransferase